MGTVPNFIISVCWGRFDAAHKPANPYLFCYGIIGGISLICNQFYAAKQIPEQPEPLPQHIYIYNVSTKGQTSNDNWGKYKSCIPFIFASMLMT